jgi:hypothetical protein
MVCKDSVLGFVPTFRGKSFVILEASTQQQEYEMTKYSISKEQNEWVVCVRKTGLIIAYFERKDQAQDYLTSQVRADEQSQVLSDFNHQQLLRELQAEMV